MKGCRTISKKCEYYISVGSSDSFCTLGLTYLFGQLFPRSPERYQQQELLLILPTTTWPSFVYP